MYDGRDMTELTMMSLADWQDHELIFFQRSFQQIMPYLNQEGQSIYKKIINEIEERGGLKQLQTDDTPSNQYS
ncbi:hypothetical protein [Bacillus andreraoultii]|uniref:hypothetical protein n=1 Tax=Bacillus andreraoultii TaxID=1499685 RepID=UPI00053B53B3|nr:hypothetical protein [Bacillus andreraoultii]